MTRFDPVLRLLCLMASAAWVCQSQATDEFYINSGSLTNTPQVDAVNFVNNGDFTVNTTLPFETFNTLNFTNTGTMTGDPGFQFDYLKYDGSRQPAANFYNGAGAAINAGTAIPSFTIPGGSLFFGVENPQLLISATNVLNKGTLLVPNTGRVHIDGVNVDLRRSSVGIEPAILASGFQTETNFSPDVGLTDIYWGMLNDGSQMLTPNALASKGPPKTTAVRFRTPPHPVTNMLSGRQVVRRVSLSLTNATGFVLTNKLSDTNWIIQGVFIQTSDTNITSDVRFAPSTISTNPFKTAVVQLGTGLTNVLDGSTFAASLYILDRIASETNFQTLTNIVTTNNPARTTFRPSNYEVTRRTPPEFRTGAKTNADVSALFDAKLYTNVPVPYVFAGYSFNVTNLDTASLPPAVPGSSTTNISGRVEIVADNLNMERARVRSEGLISITTSNLISTTRAAVDSQNVFLDLGTTNTTLRVENLVHDFVERLTGTISLWSGVFTNTSGVTVTNIDAAAGTTNVIPVDIQFHFLVVDASGLTKLQPVFVPNLTLRGAEAVLADNVTVTEKLDIETESLTIATNRSLILSPALPDLTSVFFPRVKFLTNFGLISANVTINLGQDRRFPYIHIVNYGALKAFDFDFQTGLFENHGSITAGTDPGAKIHVVADSVVLDGGALTAGGQVSFKANDFFMRNVMITNSQDVLYDFSNSIRDGGPGTTNVVISEGFELLKKPLTGDLLSTIFVTAAPKFSLVTHLWAGEDRGPNTAGFQDNVALGRLVIKSDFDTLHEFSGTTGNNGLYVDFLEFQGSITNDVLGQLQIDPGLVIYFADSNITPDILNGLFDGRLVWVPGFVGPSAVPVALQSQNRTVLMNRGLRESLSIDSDGDGIPNGKDPYPLDPDSSAIKLSQVRANSNAISFSWQAAPKTTYQIEYSSTLVGASWQALGSYTNPDDTAKQATVEDRMGAGSGTRYYRVRRQ